jgi:hypothetical protein
MILMTDDTAHNKASEKNKMNWISKLAVLAFAVVIILLSFNLMDQFGIFSRLGSLLGIRSVTEEETVIIIEEVRNIAELLTQKYYDEIFFDSGNIEGGFMQRDRRLAVIAEGYVKAGFDLSSLDENDILVEQGTVLLKLPAPKILSVVSNPSNQEIFIARGYISQSEQNRVNAIISERLNENAILAGILERSTEQGQRVLLKLLALFGFENVRIEVAKPASQLKGEELIENICRKSYSGYNTVKSETVEMDIRFERGIGMNGRTIKLSRRSVSKDVCILTLMEANGEILCELEINNGKTRIIRGGLDDQSLRIAVELGTKFDFYGIFKNRSSNIYHYLRTVNVGGPYDVIAAFPPGGKWRKLYFHRNTGLMQFIEWPMEYRGRKTIARVFFSDYRKMGSGPMIMPLKCDTFIEDRKILSCSVTAVRYDDTQ